MKPELSNKVDFSSELEEIYNLSPDSIRFFREKGYVKLKQVLSPALLEYYGEIITNWVFKLNKLTKPMEQRTTYEKAFLQVMNLWLESEQIKEFVFSKRLAQIATQLMQVEGVRLYHDQALYKEASGGITPCRPVLLAVIQCKYCYGLGATSGYTYGDGAARFCGRKPARGDRPRQRDK